ncbi:hypothetical protein Micbo1qcDRAFT_225788 [Microdochium bolleyi]|uniref:Uncharacterized protein n=1 Tax=Microdochium bolleyi TaxID=196109 RepID=A0A136J1L7_9PEZI|nr:hypothetical protein Micbo1qcDRAFT_225788 [Microdochium bolleyi]
MACKHGPLLNLCSPRHSRLLVDSYCTGDCLEHLRGTPLGKLPYTCCSPYFRLYAYAPSRLTKAWCPNARIEQVGYTYCISQCTPSQSHVQLSTPLPPRHLRVMLAHSPRSRDRPAGSVPSRVDAKTHAREHTSPRGQKRAQQGTDETVTKQARLAGKVASSQQSQDSKCWRQDTAKRDRDTPLMTATAPGSIVLDPPPRNISMAQMGGVRGQGRAVAPTGATVYAAPPGIMGCYPLRTEQAAGLVGLVPCLWVAFCSSLGYFVAW